MWGRPCGEGLVDHGDYGGYDLTALGLFGIALRHRRRRYSLAPAGCRLVSRRYVRLHSPLLRRPLLSIGHHHRRLS